MKNKITALHIEVNEEEVTIQIVDNKLHISIPKNLKCVVEHRGAGIPGVIGPDIEHDINEITEQVNKEQIGLAKEF